VYVVVAKWGKARRRLGAGKYESDQAEQEMENESIEWRVVCVCVHEEGIAYFQVYVVIMGGYVISSCRRKVYVSSSLPAVPC
jgi:hypothetical protein